VKVKKMQKLLNDYEDLDYLDGDMILESGMELHREKREKNRKEELDGTDGL
jgi:hypothetical protein